MLQCTWRLEKVALIAAALSFYLNFLTWAQVNAQANELSVAIERTRSISLLFSALQCFSDTDEITTSTIKEINHNFDPESHLDEYKNPKDVELLLSYVNKTGGQGHRNDEAFTNSPESISQLGLILKVLYTNTKNWPLFYNTSVWLADKVNSAQLFWSLMVVFGEKFPDSVVVPTMIEILPQLFIDKKEVAKVVDFQISDSSQDEHPLHYYMSDPGLNEFHTNWHIDNPFWWDENRYGVKRDRRGELFLYMHSQIIARYQSELLSNGLPDVTPLQVNPDYAIPEGFTPDVVNLNYASFPSRRKGVKLREMDNDKYLKDLQLWYDRLSRGLEQEYFLRKDGSRESLRFPNASDILGSTVESSSVYSVNIDYYGSFHNYFHRFLGGAAKGERVPGVMSHGETAMRDPLFYRLHKLIDNLYFNLKQRSPPYNRQDLDFPGLQIRSVEIQVPRSDSGRWGFHIIQPPPPTLTTYFSSRTYDIFTAARPCRGIGEKPASVRVKSLQHVPFNYIISLKSTKNLMSYGIVRIFLLPENGHDGRKLDIEESHVKAIELDRFRIQLEANRETVITRGSGASSVTKGGQSPGIKSLYALTNSTGKELFQTRLKRACGFPSNLLLPKGSKDGLRFRMVVMVSEESEPSEATEYPNYPYCGALNGVPYPDGRGMGFPFDRQGTRFISYEGIWAVLGGYAYKNVKHFLVVIKHQESLNGGKGNE